MTRGARFRIGLALAMSLSGVAMRAAAEPHSHHYRIRNHAAEERDHRKKLREERERKAKEVEAKEVEAKEVEAKEAKTEDLAAPRADR